MEEIQIRRPRFCTSFITANSSHKFTQTTTLTTTSTTTTTTTTTTTAKQKKYETVS